MSNMWKVFAPIFSLVMKFVQFTHINECWNHIANDTLSNHFSLTFTRRIRNKELQENVTLYLTMITYELQIIPRYMNNETKLHRHCSGKKLSETTSFHMELFICLLYWNMQRVSFLKIWVMHKERYLKETLLKYFNLPVIKYRVRKYSHSSGCAWRSVCFLFAQQVSDF